MNAKEVIRIITNYTYCKARLEELQEQIDGIQPKMTATYGNLAGGTGGGNNSSQVERVGNRHYELQMRQQVYQKNIEEVHTLIECSGLNDTEKRLMWWLANNGKLQTFARDNNIGSYNVYKVRDKALNKIITANAPRYVV